MKHEFIIHLIARIHDKANRFLAGELKAEGIEGAAPSHGDLLGALCINDEMSMKELAELINRDKSTVTALINKLERLGFVEKRSHPHDSRITLVSLTGKGRAIKPKILGISEKLSKKAYQNLSPEERKTLTALLMKIQRNL